LVIQTLIVNLIFLAFAATLIGSAVMVVISQHPVRSALFLVLAFFAAAGLWMMLEAEFLALVLILVYVGAVMTLFLFVIMTINIDYALLHQTSIKYYVALGIIMVGALVGFMLYVIGPAHADLAKLVTPVAHTADYSNTQALGAVLYTQYALPLEIAAVLLLAAIIAAISLCVSDARDNKSQRVDQQIDVKRGDRVRIVKMRSEKLFSSPKGEEGL
jgi:NADH-quinone oxidoreductase subunit J